MKNYLMFVVVGLISTVMLSTTSVYGQEKENVTEYVPKFFAIHHANSGTISEINSTVYSLELNAVSDKTILFSDRPDRIVKSVNTFDFIGNWSSGEDSFAVDTPNAVLVVDEQDRQQDSVIIELFNPVYDLDKKTLKYDVTLDNATNSDLPGEFEQTTMIIDVLPCFPKNSCP